MTRDQAARILHPDTREIAFVECINSDTRKWREDLEEAARMGAEALMEMREPDPDTGLMKCGCGGKAGFHYSVMMRDNDCYVECGVCGEHSKVALSEGKARDAWNYSMGYRGK